MLKYFHHSYLFVPKPSNKAELIELNGIINLILRPDEVNQRFASRLQNCELISIGHIPY